MQNSKVINFPDRSSEDQSFELFWEECQQEGQLISRSRASALFHASPEEYFRQSGWVYVLGNQYFAKDIYKIGMTTGRIERRMRQLFTTGLPGEFDCIMAYWWPDCRHAEAFVHQELEEYRVEFGREFFCADLDTIEFAFMRYAAYGDPCPSHMVEQKIRRERFANENEAIRGQPLIVPYLLEVPF